MPDREKVKKGIKACWSEYFSHKCYDCPYKDIRGEKGCIKRLGEDVLELLKEQKAKEQCLKTKCIICPHCDQCDVDENGQLKEQEDEKKRIMKVIWDTLHEGLSIDTVADQDWVYERIRHQIEDT